MTPNPSAADLSFGPFTLSRRQARLTRVGPNGPETIALTPKAFEVLAALAERPGEVIEKADLMRQVWGDTFVDDTTLSQNIFTIRKALGEGSFIETVPRRGFRFVPPAPLPPEAPAPTVPVNEPVQPSRIKWVWALAAACVALASGIAYWKLRPATEPTQPPITSLVVLPFANLSADKSQEYFADGLTEEIINALAPVPGLRVVARTSAFQFKGKPADVRDIGAKLGVDAVLEGSIRIDGDDLRVTAQLNDTRNGFHYWPRSWNHGMKDVFAVQMQVAQEVVGALGKPDQSVLKTIAPLTEHLEAYDHYLRGTALLRKSDFDESEKAFAKALKLDPHFAAAEANIARRYSLELQGELVSPEVALPQFRRHAERAMQFDPSLSLANAMKAEESFLGEWDWPAAEAAFKRAIELNPSDADAHHVYAHFLAAMGRFNEAMEQTNQTIAISPVDLFSLQHLSWHCWIVGDLARAAASARQGLSIEPTARPAQNYLK